jgi:hypothetical protein
MQSSNPFWDLYNQVRRAQFGLPDTVVQRARAFEKALATQTPAQRTLFTELNYTELVVIKRHMQKHARLTPELRGLHDRIFKNALQLDQQLPLDITKKFEEFIKGITYFSDQEDTTTSPIYHRLTACGTGAPDFRARFNQCHPGMTRKARYAVKRQIERCYIERLIYDALYRHQTLHFPSKGDDLPAQDKGHRDWLAQTHADFKSCFPTVDIRITLDAYDGTMPTHVTIVRVRRGVDTAIETYRKTIVHGELKRYDPYVECTLVTRAGIVKRKLQQFERTEARWETVSPPTRRRAGEPA